MDCMILFQSLTFPILIHLKFSDDLTYWRKNNYPIAFQNHRAAFILSGSNISINGFGIGGIHGNGDAWYNAEQAKTREGRPMPFVIWNVSSVSVRGFNIWQPALWALNIMNGTDLVFEDIYVNATATKAPWGKNWVQNTDGFDTMDVNNVSLRNLTYQGGDDCIAIKPRSYNVHVSNVSCRGGNGIAIGSLGQYLEDSSVVNVTVENVRIVRYNEDMHNSAYIKTWIGGQVTQKGYESAGVPRGGGWGSVKNITFQHFHIEGADSGPTITQDNGDNGKFSGTSKMNVEGVVFEDFEGWLSGKKVVSSVGCSKMKPCRAIEYRDMKLRTEKGGGFGGARCKNVPQGAVKGLNGGGCGS